MAEITKAISVDVAQINVFQAIVAKQNDSKSRYLEVTITNEGVPLAITPTSTVTINALREDGNSKSFSGTVNNNGIVVVPLTNWMLALDGNVKCDITVFDTENRKLTTTLFTIAVEESANLGTEISEDANYDLLTQLLTDCTNAKNDCEAAAEQANSAVDNLSGTLAGELEKYVKFTDYASEEKAGVVQTDIAKGIGVAPTDHKLYVNTLTTTDIINRTDTIGVLSMSFLNTIVKAALTDSKRISNMTDSEKANARDVIGAEQKTTIVPWPSTSTEMSVNFPAITNYVQICDHEITALSLGVSGPVPVGYECSFTFQSGATATTITYPGNMFKFVGVDCDADGDFVASANTNYEVSIRNMSTNTNSPLLVARVGVY